MGRPRVLLISPGIINDISMAEALIQCRPLPVQAQGLPPCRHALRQARPKLPLRRASRPPLAPVGSIESGP